MTDQITFQSYGGGPAANYERYFVSDISAPLAEELVEFSGLRPGERVLDVACGTGIVARLAAARVGGSAVVGVDVNPGMLAVARAAAGNTSIEWLQAGAEMLPLEDATFDVVLCQLGLQFVSDRQGALREMRRVMKPGGRLVLTLPGPIPPAFAVLERTLGRLLGPEAAAFVTAVFSLHDPEELLGLLESAGFPEAQAHAERKALAVPAAEEFLWQYVYSTPLAEAATRLNDESRAVLQEDFVRAAEPWATGGRLELEFDLTTATARRN